MKALPPAPAAHYLLKFVWIETKLQDRSLKEVVREAGIAYSQVRRSMQAKNDLRLSSIEALLNALGYTMKPVIYEPNSTPAARAHLPQRRVQ